MSDLNQTHQPGAGIIVGTAGHIDHGKTSLVYALTGTETDRLPEEKRRGISIDLGFAHMMLPEGQRVSFVDVPGHERFIKNMLAGVGGIDAVLLVVAADESVMPQTREHFEICRLLGIKQGVVAITKADLVGPQQLSETEADVRRLCAGSFLEAACAVPVSVRTGAGLDDLRRGLAKLVGVASQRREAQLMRLPVDRSFTMPGFGTVVTGTLWSGELHVGDSVRLHPSRGRAGDGRARIRGLQVHGAAVMVARAGERTAANLAGVAQEDVQRGTVITHENPVEARAAVDVAVEWIAGFEVKESRFEVAVHVGTAESGAVLKVLGEGFARLILREPMLVFPGDRFVLRRPSPAITIGGGTVVDSFPPMRGNAARSAIRLAKFIGASLTDRVRLLVSESKTDVSITDLVRMTSVPESGIKQAITETSDLLMAADGQVVVSRAWVEQQRRQAIEWLARFHAQNPAAEGASMAGARQGLRPELMQLVMNESSAFRVKGDLIALQSHKPRMTEGEVKALVAIEASFQKAGFQPPPVDDVLKLAGADLKRSRAMLEALIKAQRLVRVGPDLVFHASTLQHVRRSLASHKGRKFSVPEFKEWTQISRKYAIPLLEYLDREHVTRREGDSRVVL